GQNLLLLNSDTIVPAGALDKLLSLLEGDPRVAVVGPRLVDGKGQPGLSFGGVVSPGKEVLPEGVEPGGTANPKRGPGMPDWVSGACLLVRRSDAEAVGLLDERYFMYFEDVDFCAAIRATGRLILFTPSVQVTHLRGRSRASALRATKRAYRRSQIAFYEKH